ncbi:MAG: PqqD family peptide modification chaperone [Rhodothermales bacterium]
MNAFMVTERSTVVVKPGLTAADLGGEAVVLDPHTGRYYGLNELGARIFELSQKPRSVDRIMAALLQEYDVAEDQLRTDVVAFLREMENRELIEISDGAPA